MATDFYIKKDDRLPEIQATLLDAENTIVNLVGCSVKFIMTDKATGLKKVDANATIVNAAAGVVKYSWVSADTDIAGAFRAEFEVRFPDDRLQTFPNSKYLEIKITADLGGYDGTPAT